MNKKRHQSVEAAKSRIQMSEEMEDVSDCSVPKDGLSSVNEPCHSRRSLLDDEMDSLAHDSDETSSSSSDMPEQRVHKKKKQIKRWNLVSSSDEEADTLKDRFWRNLEEGVLPEDLAGVDLYSTVCN